MSAALDVAPKRLGTPSRVELAVTAGFVSWFGAAAVAHVALAERFEVTIPPWLPAPGLLNAASVVALAATAGLLVAARTRWRRRSMLAEPDRAQTEVISSAIPSAASPSASASASNRRSSRASGVSSAGIDGAAPVCGAASASESGGAT